MLRIKLLVLALFAAFSVALLLTDNAANPHARAYSAGPPAGFTHAPGELDCSDCHTVPAQSGGTLALGVPDKYTPGQTYDITVAHASGDATRVRWGFQMTALDAADQKAGAFAPSDGLTRVLNGEGPFPSREYVEHTSAGTFPGQQSGANWSFRWTAPPEDVGPVTFYLAGNQADGDGSSAGDNIYFTFKSAAYQAPTPDFRVSLVQPTFTVQQGDIAGYNVTLTPLNGFAGTGTVAVTGLPPGATSHPQQFTFNDNLPQIVLLTVVVPLSTPTGTYVLNVEATSGQLTRAAQATLNVVAAGDADLALGLTASPNPALANAETRFTVTVTNNGPALAMPVGLVVNVPAGVINLQPGAAVAGATCAVRAIPLAFICSALPQLAAGQSVSVDFTGRATSVGLLNLTGQVTGSDHDPLPANNRASLALSVVQPQAVAPSMSAPSLGVRTVVSGLDQPTSLAFIGADDFLVLERATGRVVRVKNGVKLGPVLDLAVNSASERGLLGIALHPGFASNGFAYLFWTESSTGADTTAVDAVPLLGNRVDRLVWNGSALTFDRTLLRLRALQTDAGQPSRGNHNGGVLRFGPDGKLYVFVGDVGRRGFFQNLPCGPTTTCPINPLVPDDQFGGPEPDDAHATGAIFRLNDDGTTPGDNPYAQIPTVQTTPVTENIKRLYAYGVRNSFGMDFDPVGGYLWTQENGDDAFDEINRVEAGFNGGWAQLMGPSSRIAEFKAIEVARGNSLQQNRWPPSNIADTAAQALARLYMLPGSKYTEPEFSWKYAVAPSPVGFGGSGLGAEYAGDLFVGASRTTLLGGYLMRFDLSADRKQLSTNDSRLADRVADNTDKFDLAESESLVVGRDFGVTTDLRTEPSKGTLYVVSLSNGAVYEVYSRPTLFVTRLSGGAETPANNSPAQGTAALLLDADGQTARVTLHFRDLSAAQTDAHIHGPAAAGQSAPPVFTLPATGDFRDFQITLTPQQVSDLKAGLFYVNVHSTAFPAGEIRGQLRQASETSAVDLELTSARVTEGGPSQRRTFNVRRYGELGEAVSVSFRTEDSFGGERTDYTTAGGPLFFASGETQKSFDVLVTDDGLPEPDETFNVHLFNTTGPLTLINPDLQVTIADNDQGSTPSNRIGETEFFVRQHYHDFLSREPDPDGFQFWVNEIEKCGADAQCREVKRINVSAAFFLSIEFQETGYFVYRIYDETFDPPPYKPFTEEVQRVGRGVVVGQPGWEQALAANRQSFVDEFVTRPAFRSKYDALSNREFVDSLYTTALVSPPPAAERDALVAALDNHTETRARVLIDVAENAEFKRAQFNRAFVLMQYYGYLRRSPNDPPDTNSDGFDFWLAKLNSFNGDYIRAEMVKAFISSDEYRKRFGP
jgi:glucose/arabinose dehydrogenase